MEEERAKLIKEISHLEANAAWFERQSALMGDAADNDKARTVLKQWRERCEKHIAARKAQLSAIGEGSSSMEQGKLVVGPPTDYPNPGQ